MSGNFYPKTTLGHLQDNVGPTLAVCQQLVVMIIMKRCRIKLNVNRHLFNDDSRIILVHSAHMQKIYRYLLNSLYKVNLLNSLIQSKTFKDVNVGNEKFL